MLCQQCQKREANVHYTQVINGKKVEMYLCEQCADEKSQFSFSPQFSLVDLLWGFPGFGGAGFTQVGHPREIRCEVCGMSFDDFRKTGKLGCSNCYRIFRNNLNPILRRLHGNTGHTGKTPAKAAGNAGEKPHEKPNEKPHDKPNEKTAPGMAHPSDNDVRRNGEVEKLKSELAAAIEKEQYEKAAELRDKIRELEAAMKKQGGAKHET